MGSRLFFASLSRVFFVFFAALEGVLVFLEGVLVFLEEVFGPRRGARP